MTASGPGQLGYQWKYNNGNLAEGGRISGVASSNLVLTSVLTNDSGSYTVVVTNAYGAVTSSPALLTVVPPPTNGATVVFDNTTTDTGQWIWNPETGNQITLATNRGERILTECIIGILANNDVTNSHMAQLRLYRNDGPTNSPGTLLYAGSPVPVPRANTFDLRFPLDSVLVPNKFTWTLRLTGDTINFPLLRTFGPPTIGTEDSTNAWLGGGTWSQFNWGLSVPATWKARFSAAQAPIPFFANATASRIVRPGSNVSFQASASGPPPLAFQWLLNGSNLNNSARLSGAGTTNLAVGSVQPSDAGLYTLAAINSAGTRSNVVSSLSVLPDPWWDADIGGLAFPGWASYNAGVWTMQADGADIYYAVDGFHFVYQTLTGDGEIVARVTSQQNTHPWAKAGVMMRESLAPFSKHAMMIVTPGNGTGFERRTDSNPQSVYTSSGDTWTTPCWLKLVRVGNTFSGYKSPNGASWTWVGSDTIAMSNSLCVGLAVDSASYGVPSTATFDQAQIVNQPDVLASPQGGMAVIGNSLTLSVAAVGASPLFYQWQLNGTNLTDNGRISGSQSNSLTLATLLLSDTGGYRVIITNAYGSVTSAVATLTVVSFSQAMVHRYSFNGDLTDSVGGANGGALMGAAYIANGQVFMNGTAGTYVNLPGGLVTNLNAVTFEFWASFGVNGNWARVFDFGDQATNGNGHHYLMFTPHSGAPDKRLCIADGDPSGFNHEQVVTDAGTLDLRTNIHVVCVYDPPNVMARLYTNGVLPSSGAITIPLANITNVFSWLGRSLYNADSYLNGSLDEFRIYGLALTAAQAYSSYTNGPDAFPLPASIITQPSSVAVTTGSSAAFNVVASGAAPLIYQWQFNGTNLTNGGPFSGAGTSNLVIAGGAVTSSVATLTVLTPALFLQPPTNQTVECSGNTTFTVVAGGDRPLSYQWSVAAISNQWAVIAGATNNSLALSNAHGAQAGLYSVVISNASGSATSAPVALTVTDTTPPVILYSFTNLTLIAGSNGQALMPDVTGTNYFRAVDSCSAVTVTQSIATNTPLTLGTRPVVLAALDGSGNAALSTNSVTVVDQTPPSVTCPTNRVLNTDPGTASRSNVTFTATATDNCGVTNVACMPPGGSTFPVGTNVVICTAQDSSGNSNSCSFTVEVTSVLSASVAETVNAHIPDGTPVGLVSSLNVDSVIERVTNITVSLVVTGGFNGDLHAYLVHGSGHAILLNRVGKTLANPSGYSDAGFNVTLADGAANGDIHTYRVALSGNPNTPLAESLTGAWAPDGRDTDPALVLDTDDRTATLSAFTGLNPNGRWMLFIADVDALYASTLVSWGLEIRGTNALPVITVPPQSRTNVLTTEAVFSVAASGLSAVSYQWQKSAVSGQWSEISGATNATLHIPNVQSNDAGSYAVRVTTLGGSVLSEPAMLTVIDQTVDGAVQMEFYAGLAGNGVGNRTVALKGTDATNGALATWNLPLNFTNRTASFTLAHAPLGLAHLSAKTAWHLRKRLGVSFTNGLATVNFTGADQLAAGDIDGSNVVDLGDYFILAGAWYTPNAAADLDGSGWVDWEDYFLMTEHWLQTGDAQ